MEGHREETSEMRVQVNEMRKMLLALELTQTEREMEVERLKLTLRDTTTQLNLLHESVRSSPREERNMEEIAATNRRAISGRDGRGART